MTNLRLYSFANYYLSDLQKGLQTAHVVGNMSTYSPVSSLYTQWAAFDKTIIIKNGGNSTDIVNLAEVLMTFGDKLNLPYGAFHEDTDSLNGAYTACAIIVPEEIYSIFGDYKKVPTVFVNSFGNTFSHNSQEFALSKLLNKYQLA